MTIGIDEVLVLTKRLKSISATSAEDAILGLHEAVTKLWIAHKRSGDVVERMANLLIGISVASNSLSITQIEDKLKERLKELV